MHGAPSLYQKYDVPAPRYTSYPTVPYWDGAPETEKLLTSFQDTLAKPLTSWALYVHVPFCETLCTFCGCNTLITRNHKTEEPYLKLLIKEFLLYLKKADVLRQSSLAELHLGGGTPTFLSAESLDFLLTSLIKNIKKAGAWIGSVEVDPRRTKREQLEVMRKHGFNRISLGVQDFNQEVQVLVNRLQSFEQTKEVTEAARALGYESVNFDLIYGLPRQSLEKMKKTIEKTLSLQPERIALYSLAIVPWIRPSQRIFKDTDLPPPQEKRELYEYSRETLLSAGYLEIGMDHFALPNDALARAQKKGRLHRNFMGYTPLRTDLLLGLGLSAISETPDYFYQNYKEMLPYEKEINKGELPPALRGHCLTEEDKTCRELILQFMTQGRVKLTSSVSKAQMENFLGEMIKDGLVLLSQNILQITKKGRPFLRNACMALDQRLLERHPSQQVFSRAL